MRALKKPSPEHNYDPAIEINDLIAYRDHIHDDPARNRHIPQIGQAGHILIATWNIANLGVHKRRNIDLKIIAEILSWFEIVAIQEVADNLKDFDLIINELPSHFRHVYNDRAGNDERSAYIYDSRRVTLQPKVGELVIVDSDRKNVKLNGITRKFHGFNRNPFLAGFRIENTNLLLANCHLLYGSMSNSVEKKESLERRQLEAFAISRWCDLRRRDKHAWTKNIIALGDFNIPLAKPGDAIYDALIKRGLRVPPHDTKIPFTNVSNSADYDQIAVTPGLKRKIIDKGVFDFDGQVFSSIYDRDRPSYWRSCAKYYISDHRPLWIQLEL